MMAHATLCNDVVVSIVPNVTGTKILNVLRNLLQNAPSDSYLSAEAVFFATAAEGAVHSVHFFNTHNFTLLAFII